MPPLHAMPPGSPYVKHRLGGWMPDDPRHFKEWLDKTVDYVRKQPKKVEDFHVSIREFYELINNDTEVRMLFSMMFEQVPLKPPYNVDPTGQWSIHTWEEMLQTFDYLLDYGPKWLYNTDGQKGLVGFPFNAVLVCNASSILLEQYTSLSLLIMLTALKRTGPWPPLLVFLPFSGRT
jgi:phosphatidylserine decarboxylase